MTKLNSIDEYMASFPKTTQKILEQLLITLKKAAPNTKETIKHEIPTLTLNGNLVHFAAYKNYIRFYPSPSGIIAFQEEIATYKHSKRTIQFPIDKPLPLDLIIKIVTFQN